MQDRTKWKQEARHNRHAGKMELGAAWVAGSAAGENGCMDAKAATGGTRY
jgi:hypothetical protein